MLDDDSQPEMSEAEIRDRVRELREQLAAGPASPGARPQETSEGVAETADGRVRVQVVGGRFKAVQLDPRVLRMPAEELGALLTETFNSALERASATATAASDEVPVDFGVLAGQLEQVQSEGLRQMDRMMQGLQEGIRLIRQRAVVNGDVGGTGGVEQVLQDAVRGVAAMRGPESETGTAEEAEPPAGEGLSGLIRVTAASTTRLGEIAVEDGALRHPSHTIADETVRAANQALDLARESAAARRPQAGDDLTAMAARMQDASLEQLSTLTESLSRLMRGIDRP
ncbi:hypothetical protein E1264_00175 [Actinomadura sp. KC216]|uniref:YbaB/EbfC family nucleoid-associated protein n=1 Tax=Actinomadura sp. KC216 TaxID=2530370 RepID=UPI001050E8B9|nr:YbaB/EbfC family nucleoid-associated protein [Actinomadura sp. KC216]TDB91922.1 hypothetical protein E1264_00175 [Actinomadura sp. KC216]